MNISIPKKFLPWAKKDKDAWFDQRYSLFELTVMFSVIGNTTWRGKCYVTPGVLLKDCGYERPGQKEREALGQALTRLSLRTGEEDNIKISYDGSKEPPVRIPLKIDVELNKTKVGNFILLSLDEYYQMVSLCSHNKKNLATMLGVYLYIKGKMGSHKYTNDDGVRVDGQGSWAYRKEIAQNVGVKTDTVDAYVSDLSKAGMIGVLSGKEEFSLNFFSIPDNLKLLEAIRADRILSKAQKNHPDRVDTGRYGKRKIGGVA